MSLLHWLKWTWPVRHLRWALTRPSTACPGCGVNRIYPPRNFCLECDLLIKQRDNWR